LAGSLRQEPVVALSPQAPGQTRRGNLPTTAFAADEPPLELPYLSVAPFVLLLLVIAVLPLIAGGWWHHNRHKALVTALFAIPMAAYLLIVQLTTGQATLAALGHELWQYLLFIVLLGSLYIISGGIVLSGDIEPRPLTNTAFLASGAVLANLIGTTGASVLLIRPFLRINRARQHTAHLPIFFIFTVSNLGGLLTPLGDPPLFLGFLNGVPFTWTLRLWPQWLVANGTVLVVFLIWDWLAGRREPTPTRIPGDQARQPLRLRGLVNLLLLLGVIAAVLLQRVLPSPATGTLTASMAGLSLLLTPAGLRRENDFTWEPIAEVAILFLGIFVTMIPALALLSAHGHQLGLSQPWEYFWLTGVLSAFLDNAPTYLTFATLAAGSTNFTALVQNEVPGLDGPLVLKAISCGAVFLGAMTYIGNGPNFMVKAIADRARFRTPSFFGYLGYSCTILLPIFGLVTVIFFCPR
jgi:Na+/H+ antiporter NhaD/arsenite permease-like protein